MKRLLLIFIVISFNAFAFNFQEESKKTVELLQVTSCQESSSGLLFENVLSTETYEYHLVSSTDSFKLVKENESGIFDVVDFDEVLGDKKRFKFAAAGFQHSKNNRYLLVQVEGARYESAYLIDLVDSSVKKLNSLFTQPFESYVPFVDDNGDIYTYTERYIYHFVNTDQGDIQCTGYNLPANEISDCIFTTQVVSEKYIVAVSRAELDLSSCPNACLHVFDREHQTARTINLGQHFINFVDLTDDTLVTSLCHDNGSLIQRYQLAGGADDNTGFYPMVSSLMIKGLNIRWGGVLDSGWWLAGEQFDTLKAGVVMLDDSAANIRICAVSPTDSYGLEGASLKDGDVLLSYSSCNRVLTERFHISECCASGLFTIEKQNEKPRLRQVLTAKSGDVSVPVCLSGTPDTMALPEFILLDVYAFYGCDECEAGDVGSSQLFRSILNSGGLYAMAYVRGSGHFGPGWAESGDWLHKQNSVDDLLSTAKMLKARYPDVPIVAMSGSAGGFIVGAALNAACGTALLDAALLMKPVVNSRDFETDIIDVCKISGATQYGESVLVSLGGLCPTANMQPGEYPPTLLVLGSRDYLINKTSAATWTEKLRENDTRNTERHYVYMHSDTHTTALCAGSKDASLAVINGFIRNCVLKISSKSVAQ